MQKEKVFNHKKDIWIVGYEKSGDAVNQQDKLRLSSRTNILLYNIYIYIIKNSLK